MKAASSFLSQMGHEDFSIFEYGHNVEKLIWVFPNPQFVEHAIPGFLILRVTLLLQRACVLELGVKPFKRAMDAWPRSRFGHMIVWYGANK